MINGCIAWLRDSIKELAAPQFCFYCKRYGNALCCPACENLIKPVLVERLLLEKSCYTDVHALSAYEDPLKVLIGAKNWSDYRASILLGRLIWNFSALQRLSFDYLVPVPLHKTKEALRGYNQAFVIAQEISLLSGKPVKDCLRRVKNTTSQARLPLHKRYDNLYNPFAYVDQQSDLEGKVLVLVDDVMTTGATLQAAGKALLESRPQKIESVVACRAL